MTHCIAGYAQTPGFSPETHRLEDYANPYLGVQYPRPMDSWLTLRAPPDHVIMTSLPHVDLSWYDYVELLTVSAPGGAEERVWRVEWEFGARPHVHRTSAVRAHFIATAPDGGLVAATAFGFRLAFSFHQVLSACPYH